MAYTPRLPAAEVETLIRGGLPMSEYAQLQVEAIEPGLARIRIPYRDWMLRPGGSVAGPILMLAADAGMYAVILGHLGAKLMALTSQMNIHFLNRAMPGDVLGKARLLKLGRRLAVCEVSLATAAAPDTRVAHCTGSYVIPD